MSENLKWKEIIDIDAFFYFDEIGLNHAVQHEIAIGLTQPKRSFFYGREDSAGVDEYINHPPGIHTEILLKYDIASWIARRNLQVTDGTDGTRDRRIATSQTLITVKSGQKKTEMDVSVEFISLEDLAKPLKLTVPYGG